MEVSQSRLGPEEALYAAIALGNVAETKRVFELFNETDPNFFYNHVASVHHAIKNGQSGEIVEFFLDQIRQHFPFSNERTPLGIAIRSGFAEVVATLLAHGFDAVLFQTWSIPP